MSDPCPTPLSPRRLGLVAVALTLLTVSTACVDDEGPIPPSKPAGGSLATQGFAVQTVCGGAQTVPGIDVSQYQGTIDWDALAASGEVEFVWMRVGNGLGTDTMFHRNWPEARRVGLRRGAYQYFRPGTDARAAAEHFLAVIDAHGGTLPDDLPHMIDVETTDGQSAATIVAAVQTWVDHVEAATGKRPVIYTGSYFWDDNVRSSAFSSYHLWTAHYTQAACPLTSSSWSRWTIWQYSSTGRVTGITGDVDLNRFDGTLEDLDLWPTCSQFNPLRECLAPAWWCEPLDALEQAGVLEATCADFRSDSRFRRSEWAELVGRALCL
jgi:lysozyme